MQKKGLTETQTGYILIYTRNEPVFLKLVEVPGMEHISREYRNCNCKVSTYPGGKMMVETAYPVINMRETGRRICELRKERGITVRMLCEYMGFTEPQAIYKWQRGDSLPTVDNLFALSRILGTSIEDILIGDDEMSSRFCFFIYR